jgi:hypothetical protein
MQATCGRRFSRDESEVGLMDLTEKRQLGVGFLFAGQAQHLLLLALLIPGAFFLARPALEGGTFLGIGETHWFWAAVGVAVAHQVVVALVFRAQLVFGFLTRLFGERDLLVWGMIFFPFFLLRPLLTVALGLADYGSLGPLWGLHVAMGVILLLPAAYTGWSVLRYFDLTRALGADHFRERYRHMPLVREGAFRYSSNAMYAYAFFLLWAMALFTSSRAALVLALFQHAYVWVHWYCTEQPDMDVIYGGD